MSSGTPSGYDRGAMNEETFRPEKRERSFDLPLPGLVRGQDAAGRVFEERTEIRAISAQEAVFPLGAPLQAGARVALVLDIPRTLILEKPLLLQVSGAVASIGRAAGGEGRQLVALALDRAFRLSPDAQED
jgi:hypothetical protein